MLPLSDRPEAGKHRRRIAWRRLDFHREKIPPALQQKIYFDVSRLSRCPVEDFVEQLTLLGVGSQEHQQEALYRLLIAPSFYYAK
jgi:hypothetical protein